MRFDLQHSDSCSLTSYMHKFYRYHKLDLQHVKNIIEVISRLVLTGRMWKGIVAKCIFISKSQSYVSSETLYEGTVFLDSLENESMAQAYGKNKKRLSIKCK